MIFAVTFYSNGQTKILDIKGGISFKMDEIIKQGVVRLYVTPSRSDAQKAEQQLKHSSTKIVVDPTAIPETNEIAPQSSLDTEAKPNIAQDDPPSSVLIKTADLDNRTRELLSDHNNTVGKMYAFAPEYSVDKIAEDGTITEATLLGLRLVELDS